MTTRKDIQLLLLGCIYLLCRCIYWDKYTQYIFWDLFYHVAEKGFPIMLVLIFWDKISYKPIGVFIISLCVFFACYSILYRYTDYVPTIATDKLIWTAITYSIFVFGASVLFFKKFRI